MWLSIQEAATIDRQLASVALGQFKSCVRTTLLLCDGYECQETEGAFLVAFSSPRAALEWALVLQLALLRYICYTNSASRWSAVAVGCRCAYITSLLLIKSMT